ncbi:hypothetical protein [Prevotella nigrescens]|uniref:hypothetical protein n=1 Tax=Prevotella nigrescens TaxID=28133 RepID=UPI00211AFCF5|nr:hypothetical protein [Prevotella nigrescens]
MDEDLQRETVFRLLQMDLEPEAVAYYMAKIDEEQRRCKDSYSQVIQVVYEKHQQPKFQQGTKKYKQKCLVDFVFTKNLQNYGWHIKSYKEKTSL